MNDDKYAVHLKRTAVAEDYGRPALVLCNPVTSELGTF